MGENAFGEAVMTMLPGAGAGATTGAATGALTTVAGHREEEGGKEEGEACVEPTGRTGIMMMMMMI